MSMLSGDFSCFARLEYWWRGWGFFVEVGVMVVLKFMPAWVCCIFMDFSPNIIWVFYLEILFLFFVVSEEFVLLKLIKTKPKYIVFCWQWRSWVCFILNLTDGILEDKRTCCLCKNLISVQLLLEVTVKTY